MGCGASTEAPPPGAPTARGPAGSAATTAAIDKVINRAQQEEELKVKLLLLGAGESGKSTIFKQMRILYGAPRGDDDLRMYGVVVRSNVVTVVRKLCLLVRRLEMEGKLESVLSFHSGLCTGLSAKSSEKRL